MLGNRIRNRREELGVNQKELAAKLGITSQAVSSWEKNRCEPDNRTLCKIAELLEVDVNYLCGYEGKSTVTEQTTEVNTLAAVRAEELQKELKRVIESSKAKIPESSKLTLEDAEAIHRIYINDHELEVFAFYAYGFNKAMEYMNRSREVPEAFTAEQMEEIHSYFMENIEQPAPDEVREWEKKLHRALDGYLEAVGDNMFKQAFTFGRMYDKLAPVLRQ